MKISTGYRIIDGNDRAWIDKSVSEGYRHMEIPTTNLPTDPDAADAVIAYAKERGFTLSLHAPFGKTNITASDPEVRTWSIERVRAAITLAGKHGIDIVTLHPGRLSSPEESAEENIALMRKTLTELAALGRECGVRIGLENMEARPNELIHTVEELNLFADLAAENPYFGATIDFSHYLTLGIGLPDLSLLKLPIYDVHISQTVEGKPHFTLERAGAVDLFAVVSALDRYGYEGPAVLEVREGHGPSFAILSEVIKHA